MSQNHYQDYVGEEHHDHGHGGDDHGHDISDHIQAIPTSGALNLINQIDLTNVKGLNCFQNNEDLGKVFEKSLDSNNEQRFLTLPMISSDTADPQLILEIPFLNSSVKLYSIILRTGLNSHCGKIIKVFKNKYGKMDFDSAESSKPDFVLKHPNIGIQTNEQYETNTETFVEHHLPRHLFTNLTSITLFIESVYNEENGGAENSDEDDEDSRIHYIELRGEYRKLTKDPLITMYESAANPADHAKVKNKLAEFGTSSSMLS